MVVISLLSLFLLHDVKAAGILYPRSSETRELVSLDGLWNFALINNIIESTNGLINRWYKINFRELDDLDIQRMPVPASYNDIGTDTNLRDHVGTVLYQRTFHVPKSWKDQKVWVRFASACHGAEVVMGYGNWVLSHDIGHLPFQAEISSVLSYGNENTIMVVVDNILTQTTIPQGTVSELASGRIKQKYGFDFFNYAGIDRPVLLYTTPSTLMTSQYLQISNGANGFVTYSIVLEGTDTVTTQVTLLDKNGKVVVSDTALNGTLLVPKANFWWPYLMDPSPGYLYSLEVQLLDASGNLVDKYALPVGIRTISWDSKTVKINNKPIYLRGFGRHEDSDIRGRGLDLSLIIRDYNFIKWIGANSYRTSHYPYAEEIMDLVDKLGIMIINESPAVHTVNYSDELLENHKKSLTELIQRDKNRPSVIMWSAANEPDTQLEAAEHYYKQIVAHIKSLDSSRPVTVVNYQPPDDEHSGQFLDVASFNAYYGWYGDNPGDLDVIVSNVLSVARRWNELHNIPVIMTEYGADTQEGLHILPSFVWSEEYQNALLSKHFEAFDQLREEGFFVGEMIWNFADFKTAQSIKRLGGNKKGVFTRNRQPKASAHLLRKRYWILAENLDNAEVPDDLNEYIFDISAIRDE